MHCDLPLLRTGSAEPSGRWFRTVRNGCVALLLSALVAGGCVDGTTGGGEDEPTNVTGGVSDATSGNDLGGGGVDPDGGAEEADASGFQCSGKWKDEDGDRVPCEYDNCPTKKNADQKDDDGDTYGNPCDNCPQIPNVDQKDSNNDGKGDACTPELGGVEVDDGDGMDSDGDGLSDSDEMETGTKPSDPDSDGDGILDGTEVTVGTDPGSSDSACLSKTSKAKTVQKPIDIVFVIDNSGSMDEEIGEVERRINDDFAQIIQMSGVDYRVIMLSARGRSENEVCIDSPLGGGCGDTAQFKHLDEIIFSHDSLNTILETYSEWKQWLRKDAFVVFVEISDDNPDDFQEALGRGRDKAEEFERQLFAKSKEHFGSASKRNYIFHSIVSVSPKGGNQAYQPDEPINGSECSSSADTATTYEWLSKLSGGLRYPVCKTNSYDAVFNEIAEGVVDRAQIGCELDLPKLPSGKYLDKDGVALQFREKQGGDAELLTLVSSQSKCSDGHFYLDGKTVKLCSATCKRVSQSKNGRLRVLAGCQDCETINPEICDGKDNDCDGEVDEGCPACKLPGASCENDSECCNGNCRSSSGVCGPPCRPTGIVCTAGSQCCSGECGTDGLCGGG